MIDGTKIDSKHGAWADTLAASDVEYKSTIHHFIVVEGKPRPVFYGDIEHTAAERTGRQTID